MKSVQHVYTLINDFLLIDLAFEYLIIKKPLIRLFYCVLYFFDFLSPSYWDGCYNKKIRWKYKHVRANKLFGYPYASPLRGCVINCSRQFIHTYKKVIKHHLALSAFQQPVYQSKQYILAPARQIQI